MSLNVDGITYFLAAEVVTTLCISRVTLWRWRSARKIPQGNLLRGRQVVFTATEVAAIREYALRVEPITHEGADQLRLFGPRS